MSKTKETIELFIKENRRVSKFFARELLEAVLEEMRLEGGHGCSSHRLIESLIDEIK